MPMLWYNFSNVVHAYAQDLVEGGDFKFSVSDYSRLSRVQDRQVVVMADASPCDHWIASLR